MTKKHQHFGVYAFVINVQTNAILLIKKTRGPYTGMLDLPGGSPEENETSEETLIREVKEETGADTYKATDMGEFETQFKYMENKQPWLLIHTGKIFQTILKGTILEDLTSSDTSGCVWVLADRISDFDVTPPVLQAVKMYNKY